MFIASFANLFPSLFFPLMPKKILENNIESGIIEIAPLAFMRGRTLENAFIILDEAQNTSAVQMKMFLTRLGNNSKMVITGDLSQIDLPDKKSSGLLDAEKNLKKIKKYFTREYEPYVIGKITKGKNKIKLNEKINWS